MKLLITLTLVISSFAAPAHARPLSRRRNEAPTGCAFAALAHSVASRLEAGVDWHDARTGRLWSIDPVLTQISSSWIGFLYVATFGFGSIVGMLLMSGIIGLPFALATQKLTNFTLGIQTLAAVLSICFGIWYAYEASTNATLF